MGKETAPGPQEQRFAAYIEGLAEAAGHADRHVPLKNYCTGLSTALFSGGGNNASGNRRIELQLKLAF